jgi:hypothetical protein
MEKFDSLQQRILLPVIGGPLRRLHYLLDKYMYDVDRIVVQYSKPIWKLFATGSILDADIVGLFLFPYFERICWNAQPPWSI